MNKIKRRRYLKIAGIITAASIVPLMLTACSEKKVDNSTPAPVEPTVNPTPTPDVKPDVETPTPTPSIGTDENPTPDTVVKNTITYKKDPNLVLKGEGLEVKNGEGFTLEVPELERMYEFDGWFTASGEQITDSNGASLEPWNSVLGDITLEARYSTKVTYEEIDGGLRVKGNDLTKELVDLRIPQMHDGKKVLELGDFSGHALLKKVILPESINTISDTAFKDSLELEAFEVYEVDGEEAIFSEEDGVLFTDNGATLFKYPIMKADEEYDVPATVTKLASHSFEGYTDFGSKVGKLKVVNLPATIKEIGDYAFSMRTTITTVNFAENSRTELTIGDYAFAYNTIESFVIPANTVSIGNYAFATDLFNSLVTTELEADLVLPEGLRSIGNYAFTFNNNLKKVTLPNSLEAIGEGAFESSSINELVFPEAGKLTAISNNMLAKTYITEINIPGYIKTIGDGALENTDITKITLNEGLLTIGRRAFAKNANLTVLNIPGTVTSLGEAWMIECPGITAEGLEVDPDSTVLTKKDGIIYNGDLTEIFLYPENLTLTEYIMPNTLKSIPEGLFKYNRYIKSVTLSESLTEIPAYAFYSCDIEKIIIPASVEAIYEKAFSPAKNLDDNVTRGVGSIEFAPNSKLKTIGKEAFYKINMTSFTVPNGVLTIEEGAFNDSKVATLNIPASVTSISSRLSYGAMGKLAAINVDSANETYVSKDGVLYTKDLKTLVCYPSKKAKANEYVLPKETLEIAPSAMSRANVIKLVGANLKSIGADSLYKSKVEAVELPKLEEIADTGFRQSNIKSIDLTNVRSIGVETFIDCTKLTSVTFGHELTEIPTGAFRGSALASATIPGNIKTIGARAFENTKLTKVVLEEGVETIGESAFKNAIKLAEITLPATLHEIAKEAFMVTSEYESENGKASLNEISIPSGLKLIGDGAFSGNQLSKITVDSNNRYLSGDSKNTSILTKDGKKMLLLGSKACQGEYVVDEGVEEITTGIFTNATGITKITLSSTVKVVGDYLAVGATSLAEFAVAEGNTSFKVVDGVLYSADMKKLVYYPQAKADTKFSIPEGVEEIAATAFAKLGSSCKLNELVMPKTLKVKYATSFSEFKSLRTLEINSQEMIDKLNNPNQAGYDADPMTAYAKTIRVKEGLNVNKYITEGFEVATEQAIEGYTVYTRKAQN